MDDVAADVNAFGFGGVGYMHEAQEGGSPIEAVAVESDNPEFEGEFFLPTEDNIETGAYSPLARPLFVYVNHATMQENPMIADFIRHYINRQDEHSDNAGFYASPDEVQHENHDRLNGVIEELGIEDEVSVEAQYY